MTLKRAAALLACAMLASMAWPLLKAASRRVHCGVFRRVRKRSVLSLTCR